MKISSQYLTLGAGDSVTRNSYNQLVDDALHTFKKSIQHAMEVGMQEQLAFEKQNLLLQLQQLQERNALLEKENQAYKIQTQ